MADADYQAWVEVLPDLSKVNSRITSGFTQAGQAGGAAFGNGFRNSGVGQIFSGNLLANLVTGAINNTAYLVGAGIGAAINYGLDSVDLAGALIEQKNAVVVAFGEVSAEIDQLASTAPKRLNLTQVAFNQLAVRFSSFARTIAGEGGDVAHVIDDLTQRGADFASVYDIEASEALALFQSGLAGETEPLRRFGLDLSAARIQTDALKFGIIDSNRELTEAEKIQTRYLSLLDQTSQVQGDLANTAGSYANQQRQFAVALEEAQTKFGAAILPIATDVLSWANTEFLPILEPVLAEVGPKLSDSISAAMPEIKELLKSAGEVLPEAIQIGLDSLTADTKFISDLLKIINGDLSPIAEANDSPGANNYNNTNPLTDPLLYFGTPADGSPEAPVLFGDDFVSHEEQLESHLNTLYDKWDNYSADVGAELDTSAQDFAGYANDIQAQLAYLPARAELIGLDIPRGLARGINLTKGEAVAEAGAMAAEVVARAKAVLDSNSPSKVFERIGADVNAGFAAGMAKTTPTWDYDFRGVQTSGAASSAAAVATTWHLNGVDPMVVAQLVKQELDLRLTR